MKIAVVGAGVGGLSVAWHLLELSKATIAVDIFDPLPVGEGVSGSASGLISPYTSSRASLHWQGELMVAGAHHLLTAAAPYCSQPPVLSRGILRLPKTSEQMIDFQNRGESDQACEWWDKKRLQKYLPYLTLPDQSGALYIKNGVTIDMKIYLKGLMQATLRLGAQWKQEAITDPSIFANYDRVIIAMGANMGDFDIFQKLPITKIKGQLLEVVWPLHLPPLPMSIQSSVHIVMRPDHKSCLIGSTFERNYTNGAPDIEFAKKQLLTKAVTLIPDLEKTEILECKSGIRACSGTHKPLLGQLNERFWFFTGFCAKGLLYHGFLGKCLATAVLLEELEAIPAEVYHKIDL